jgi:hypothetical protein
LLAFFGGRDGRSSGRSGEDADRSAGSAARYSANERAQSRAANHLFLAVFEPSPLPLTS